MKQAGELYKKVEITAHLQNESLGGRGNQYFSTGDNSCSLNNPELLEWVGHGEYTDSGQFVKIAKNTAEGAGTGC